LHNDESIGAYVAHEVGHDDGVDGGGCRVGPEDELEPPRGVATHQIIAVTWGGVGDIYKKIYYFFYTTRFLIYFIKKYYLLLRVEDAEKCK
jgi:hypothetical protein